MFTLTVRESFRLIMRRSNRPPAPESDLAQVARAMEAMAAAMAQQNVVMAQQHNVSTQQQAAMAQQHQAAME